MTGIAVEKQPVISAWSAISPFGQGREAYRRGVLAGRGTAAPVDRDTWSVPDERACVVPDFDPRSLGGGKGARSINRVTGLTVAAVGELLADAHRDEADGGAGETALVLGTTNGSAQSTMDFTRASLVEEKPFHVEPANVPGTVMNCAAGRAAIWYQLTGPNATIAAGRVSGLRALNYARRLLLTGRARRVLCGAAEEYSNARSWLEHRRGESSAVIGEGCAMLLLEPADAVHPDARPLATLLGLESRMCLDGDYATAVRTGVRRLLSRDGSDPAEVWIAGGSGAGGPADRAERDVLRELFGDAAVHRMPRADLIGDTAAAAATFRIATVLSVAESDPAAADRLAVITACDNDGAVSCALLRMHGGAR